MIYTRYINRLQIGLKIGYKLGIPLLPLDGKQVVQFGFTLELFKYRSNDLPDAVLLYLLARRNTTRDFRYYLLFLHSILTF
jgi:hypothetical protein